MTRHRDTLYTAPVSSRSRSVSGRFFAALIFASGLSLLSGSAMAASIDTSFLSAAVPSRLADQSMMLDVARAGTRLVSVGERGRVLLSDDSGRHWRQSSAVPVSVTLTAVTFVDAKNGWATGHAGVVIHTADGGESWTLQLDGKRGAQMTLDAVSSRPADDPAQKAARQLVADGPDKPLLALQFTSARNGLVVGAYGLIFSTEDGGATWVPRLADVDNPGALHLNAICTVGGYTYIAGERGLLLRAEGSGRFTRLQSPYDGSWFTVDATPDGGVVVAGLRGHAYRSSDAGASWQQISVPGGLTLLKATPVAPSLVLFVDQSGSVLSLDGSSRMTLLVPPSAAPATAVALAPDGSVAAATLRGPARLPVDLFTVIQKSASR